MILLGYRALVPFLSLLLPVVALFNAKVREGLNLRRRRLVAPDFERPPIWIHASSGEFEYAKPVIRELKRRHPARPIVVTYFSPTFARQVGEFPGVDHAEPLPLDLPGPVSAFLNRVRPALCLIARTDLWPEVLTQTGRRGIPRVVFAYTQPRVGRWRAILTRWRLNLVDHVAVVAEADRALVRDLAIKPNVTRAGDPRYDQVADRLAHPRAVPDVFASDLPQLVAGSTWDEDERVLIPALAPALRAKKLRLILVPHEPTPRHLDRTRSRLDAAGLKYRLTSARASGGDHPVVVVDEVGYLAELYARADFAFIGGSFKAKVHSVMEALGAGAITLTGPYVRNNREAEEFRELDLGPAPGLTVVADAEALRVAVDAWLGRDYRAIKPLVRAEFERRTGAARRLVDLMADWVADL